MCSWLVYLQVGEPMNFKEYQDAAATTMRKMSFRDALAMGAIGLCGEAGEVSEPIKKHLFHGKVLDVQELSKEIGDVLWYLSCLCSTLDLSLEDVAEGNIQKLKARHGG